MIGDAERIRVEKERRVIVDEDDALRETRPVLSTLRGEHGRRGEQEMAGVTCKSSEVLDVTHHAAMRDERWSRRSRKTSIAV